MIMTAGMIFTVMMKIRLQVRLRSYKNRGVCTARGIRVGVNEDCRLAILYFSAPEVGLMRDLTDSQSVAALPNCWFEFHKRGQLFIRMRQRTACRCRGVRLQSRSFARWDQSLRRSPNSNRALLRLSAIISQYFTVRSAFGQVTNSQEEGLPDT